MLSSPGGPPVANCWLLQGRPLWPDGSWEKCSRWSFTRQMWVLSSVQQVWLEASTFHHWEKKQRRLQT